MTRFMTFSKNLRGISVVDGYKCGSESLCQKIGRDQWNRALCNNRSISTNTFEIIEIQHCSHEQISKLFERKQIKRVKKLQSTKMVANIGVAFMYVNLFHSSHKF